MVRCKAFGCTNKPDKGKDKKWHYFCLPSEKKDKTRLERWLHNIGTGLTIKTYVQNDNNRVCSEHFHADCIQEDKMAKLLNYTPKQARLKPSAIPTIFVH